MKAEHLFTILMDKLSLFLQCFLHDIDIVKLMEMDDILSEELLGEGDP